MGLYFYSAIEFFARAGGGGSGGSDDGGGSILALIGYVPMHALGSLLRKKLSANVSEKVIANFVGWIAAIAYGIFLYLFFRGFLGFILIILVLVGMPAGLYGWFGKIKQSAAVKQQLQNSAAQDGAWDEKTLTEFAKNTFLRYQFDWSHQDVETMKTYMTPQYQYHASLLVYTLQQLRRSNYISEISIEEALISHVHDSQDNSQDTFTIGFTAKANDVLVDNDTQQALFTDKTPFTEYWTFVRSGSTWLIDGISQATADMAAYNNEIASFAQQSGYKYSVDMGCLFIPKRGQLFGGAKFGKSDINNHVVGMYKNILVQLYTYSKMEGEKTKVIAQVNVPKNYGNIVVRRKKALQFKISGLQKVETEWTAFNDKYEVFATSTEQATSFELLNPKYMEQLEALPFKVNIEVVDNVIYLYVDEIGADANVYAQMYSLVQSAFVELRL